MNKPSVYLDSNIFSMLEYRGGHVASLAQHMKTQAWWEQERRFFALHTSRWTEIELARGVYGWQPEAVAAARRTAFLPRTSRVRACADTYVKAGLVPAGKFGDAMQLAFATAHRMDYLLTWNHAHLANVDMQHRLERLNERMGWRTPWLVSPETIPWASQGQRIRRADDE